MWTSEGDVRYRVLWPLGTGGMADVVLAHDTVLDRSVALKRVRTAKDVRAQKRLRREATVGASITHPNLVRIYDVQEQGDGDVVVVMEYVAGDTLQDLIRSRGRLQPARALRILSGVADAIDAVHDRGVVHRDVKPANILLGLDGSVKLADLGIAAVDDHTKITTAGQVIGTFSYMSPEQLEGKPPQPAMDIYAFAAMAFEALSGRKARPEPNPVALAHSIATRPPPDLREHWPEAPAGAAEVLKRGMSSDPARRPRTAGELVARLRAAFAAEDTQEDAAPTVMAAPEAAGAVDEPVSPAPVAAAALVSRRAARGPAPAPAPRRPGGSRRPPERRRPVVVARDVHRPPGDLVGAPDAQTKRRRRIPVTVLVALVALAIAAAAVAALSSGGASTRSRVASNSAGQTSGARKAVGPALTRVQVPALAKVQPPARPAATAQVSTTTPASVPPPNSTPSASTATASVGTAIAHDTTATPDGAVQTFYEAAARHEYGTAWALADSNLRNQLQGFGSFEGQMSRVRVITFHAAQTVRQDSSVATVALDTTAVLTDRTQHCSGTAQTVRGSTGSWLLDHISISCDRV